MRRPTSSSCLLLPRGSSYDEGDTQTNESSPSAALSPNNLSVTILSKDKLLSYSSERFFLLAEVEVHAQPTAFLYGTADENCSLTQASDETDDETQPPYPIVPPYSVLNSAFRGSVAHTVEPTVDDAASWPPHVLLYLLWRPHHTNDPTLFTELYILDAVSKLREVVDLEARSVLSESMCFGTHETTLSNGTVSHSTVSFNNTEPLHQVTNRPKTSLYVVVDRVMPVEVDDSTIEPGRTNETYGCSIRQSHASQEDLAEQLARSVASHAVLRGIVQGISVGVANHVRAAPGLELCVSAITLGATDRRRHDNGNPSNAMDAANDAKRSLLGIVALSPSDLLGLQDATVTDAAQGVLQTKVTAEWNGQGDLQSFAARVHNIWRKQHGIPIPLESYGARKIPRRIRRSRPSRSASKRQALFRYRGGRGGTNGLVRRLRQVWSIRFTYEQGKDVVAFFFLCSYVAFHFGTPLVQFLTNVTLAWNDFIRSARGW